MFNYLPLVVTVIGSSESNTGSVEYRISMDYGSLYKRLLMEIFIWYSVSIFI